MLVGADVGVRTSAALLQPLRDRLRRGRVARARCAPRSRRRCGGMLAAPPPPEPSARPWVILVTGRERRREDHDDRQAGGAARGGRAGASCWWRRTPSGPRRSSSCAVWAERTGADLVRHEPGRRSVGGRVRRPEGGRGARRRRRAHRHGRPAAHPRHPDGGAAARWAGSSRARCPGPPTRRCWSSTPRPGRTPSARRAPSRRPSRSPGSC